LSGSNGQHTTNEPLFPNKIPNNLQGWEIECLLKVSKTLNSALEFHQVKPNRISYQRMGPGLNMVAEGSVDVVIGTMYWSGNLPQVADSTVVFLLML
jgi:hypothetical protein